MTAASRLRPGMHVRWAGRERIVESVSQPEHDRLISITFADGLLTTVLPGTIFETYRKAGS